MIQDLEHRFIIARWMYSIAEPILSDPEYDILLGLMKSEGVLEEYTERSWSSDPCPMDLLKQYGMQDKIVEVALLEKTSSMESITTELELSSMYSDMEGPHTLTYKEDGFNTSSSYYNGELVTYHTRGRATDAMDLSIIAHLLPKRISMMGHVKIIHEAVLSDENFEKLKTLYPGKNLVSQRSAVRTAIVNREAHHLLSIRSFDIITEDAEDLSATHTFAKLREMGFETPAIMVVNNFEELQTALKLMSDRAPSYGYKPDGIVIRSDKDRITRAVRIGHWTPKIHKSYVVTYEEGTGPMEMSLKLLIRPIKLDKSTQRRINITNLARVLEYGLLPGSPVAFTLTSDAIAVFDVFTTLILQRQYKGNYASYKYLIDDIEQCKQSSTTTEQPVDYL